MPDLRSYFSDILAGLAALALICIAAGAQAQHAPENQLKAALIFNFVQFTEWPLAVLPEGEPLTMCLLKNTVMTEALSLLEHKTVGSHLLHFRFLHDNDNLQGCKVVYLEEDERYRLPQFRKKMEELNVLTISDRSGATEEGAMIAIAVDSNRFIFEINASAARQARLNISSKLLRLARKVL